MRKSEFKQPTPTQQNTELLLFLNQIEIMSN